VTTIENISATSSLLYGNPNDEISANIAMTSSVGGVTINLNPIALDNIGTGTIVAGGPNVVINIGGGITGPGVSDTDEVTYTIVGDVGEFIGAGTFTLDALALSVQSVSLSGQGSVSVQLEAAANAEVIYEYREHTVPAPGAIALLGLGFVAMTAVRRRKAPLGRSARD